LAQAIVTASKAEGLNRINRRFVHREKEPLQNVWFVKESLCGKLEFIREYHEVTEEAEKLSNTILRVRRSS
jgi:hypothetical protein